MMHTSLVTMMRGERVCAGDDAKSHAQRHMKRFVLTLSRGRPVSSEWSQELLVPKAICPARVQPFIPVLLFSRVRSAKRELGNHHA
jgi:hypothetical protein